MKPFLKRHTFLISFGLFLLVFGIFGTFSVLKSNEMVYTVSAPENAKIIEIYAECEGDRVLELTETRIDSDGALIKLRAAGSGKATLAVHYIRDYAGQRQEITEYMNVSVTKTGVIFVGSGILDYEGFPIIYNGITLYTGLMALYFMWRHREQKKEMYFSYKTVYTLSAEIFFLVIFVIYLAAVLISRVRGMDFSVKLMVLFTNNLTTGYVFLTMPIVAVFSIALAVSNVQLIKHEGKKPRNMLGIACAFMLMGGTALVLWLMHLNYHVEQTGVAIPVIYSIVSACFAIFQVLLVSSEITCYGAGSRKVPFGKQFIIILGCAIRKDGTLYPLIRGRVDRAIRFWKEQYEATGEKAVFIPSGGQGRDEVTSESEAMKKYMLEQGIPEEYILSEDRSKTTLQNMTYSKKLIDEREHDASVVFSTTNYHVFRSGLFASQAGLHADGIGARTKAYFWPNAMLREVVGILAVQPKAQLIVIAVIILSTGFGGYLFSLL